MKPKLWHKIFLYSFLTIIITQVFTLGFYLFTYDQDLRVKTTVDYLAAISKNLEGLSDEEFKSFVEVYRVGHRRVWLEDRAGGILIGEPWPGMTAGVRDQVTSKRYDYDHGMTALVLRTAEPAIVVEIETTRAGVPALICFNWQRASLVQYWGVFVQGVLGLIGLSLVLSLWTSKRISKPLWDLRNSLMKISAGDLALRLSQEGEDEIADVSAAVNQLTDNLSKHMTGMKQLMANMSHELRSSVTNLSMSLEILEAALNAPTAKPTLNGASPAVDSEPGSVAKEANLISENLNQARLEVNLLENMVASGLLGGKLDLKHEELESAPLDFSSLCRQTVSRFTHLAALKNITLKRDIDEELWLFGDEIILDRMLANVLDNAIKYTKPDGHIAFSIKTDGDFLIVTCLNTHPPLSAEQLQNLCLPYYRAEEGRIYGSGLGLYLVKKIVLLHGGSLEVKNDPPGVCVTIKLPRPDEPQT